MRKRFLSLLLILLLVASLCGTAWAEEEKVYVQKERELLIKKTEKGCRLPYHGALVQGRVLDKVTDYSYDEFGNLTEEKISYNYNSYGIDHDNAACTYDNEGRLRREEITQTSLFGSDALILDYDESGSICRVEKQWKNNGLKETDIYEFNNEGYCTRFFNEIETVGKAETLYEYDEDGNLTFLITSVNEGPLQTMTPVYEDGRQVATKHVAPDGDEVMEYFRYDDEGRLTLIEYDAAEPHKSNYFYYTDFVNGEFRYNEYKAGDQHITISFRYNDLGFVGDAEWRTNGNFVAWTQYSYPPDNDGGYGYSLTDNGYGPYILGGTLSSSSWYSEKTYTSSGGNPTLAYTYEMKILGDDPRYVESILDCDYENVNVKVEIQPQADLGGLSVEDFYPDLRESYLGMPTPTPDGSKRLIRVKMKRFLVLDRIPVVAELAYAADGNLVGMETRFDLESFAEECRWSPESEFDELGRVTYITNCYIHYADDGQAYTITQPSGYKKECHIGDLQIQDWVKRGPLEYYGNEEVNEDGLLTRWVTHSTTQDYVTEYAYHWETSVNNWETNTDDNIALKTDMGLDTLCFDSHGYLYKYCIPNSIEFSYIYE